jgi:hypothetical protein
MGSDRIRKVGSTFGQLVEVKVGRNLSKAELLGLYNRLVRFITRLGNIVKSSCQLEGSKGGS